MKITEVSADGLGVSALIAAAGKIHELTEERNIALAAIEGVPGSGIIDTMVVYGKRDSEQGPPFVAVTMERKPRVLYVEKDGEPVPEHHESYGDHYPDGDGVLCVCTRPCCNEAEECTCPPCTSRSHDHSGRAEAKRKPPTAWPR